jgi:Holliday junction resolvase RusA-like endonuclease
MSNAQGIQTLRSAVTFTVPGDPVPQPRPRVSTRGGYGRAYVPAKHPVHEFRSRVARAAQAAGLTKAASPVTIKIEATFGRPRSHYRKAGVKPTAPTLPRPDCDNLAKAVLDALQDVLGDDTKVSRLVVEKKWAADGYTKVEVASGEFSVVHEPEQEPLQETLAGKITKESNNGKK